MRRTRRWLLGAGLGAAALGAGWAFRKKIRRLMRPAEGPASGLFLDPEGLAVDAAGRLYVADEDRGEFFLLDPQGRVLHRLSGLEGLDGPVTNGDSMAVLAPGRVVAISGHRLVEFEIEPGRARLIRVLGRPGRGPGEFQDPEGIARDASGRLYVTDEDSRRIQVFEPDGRVSAEWQVPEDPESIGLFGGRVYVTFSKACWVGVYDPFGRFLFRFGSRGSDPGRFRIPDFVGPSPEGLIYVTDQGNHRIQT
ncbi:MAG: NHL repeat-containing protein, partial [Planctomycetota bacterium]